MRCHRRCSCRLLDVVEGSAAQRFDRFEGSRESNIGLVRTAALPIKVSSWPQFDNDNPLFFRIQKNEYAFSFLFNASVRVVQMPCHGAFVSRAPCLDYAPSVCQPQRKK